jgi:hypothetical protein
VEEKNMDRGPEGGRVEIIRKCFLKEAKPFVEKRDLNWKRITQASLAALVILIIALLLMPEAKPQPGNFHERFPGGSSQAVQADPANDALKQLQQSSANYHSSSISSSNSGGSVGGSTGQPNRDASMIIARLGNNGKISLPAGTRLSVRITSSAVVSTQPIPVIGVIEAEVTQADSTALPQGAQLFGEATLDDSADRADVIWKVVRLPDGRERPLAAIGISADGHAGVEGKVHSDAVKNTAGQTLKRFVAAYAEGSMQKGAFGANTGGSENGIKNAVSETAKDRAENWGKGLQKQKKWIELRAGTSCFAILSSSYQFRDPGSTYGR